MSMWPSSRSWRGPWRQWRRVSPGNAEAVLAAQHVGHGLAEVGFARDPCGLGGQPCEELIDQRAGQLLPDGSAVIRVGPPDGILDLVEGGDAQQRLVDDG